VSGEGVLGEACDEALADPRGGLFDLGEGHADRVGEWVVGVVGDERDELVDDAIEVDGRGSGEGHGNLREMGNAFSGHPWAKNENSPEPIATWTSVRKPSLAPLSAAIFLLTFAITPPSG
jgi:hypothetical protein